MMVFAIACSWFGLTIAEVSVADLEKRFAAGRDTVYVVNFWATWCKPCVEELPAFDKLSRAEANNQVVVLLVSVDSPNDRNAKVETFLRKKGFSCETAMLNESNPHIWIDKVDPSWSGAIPATLFVSQGKRLFKEQEFTYRILDSTFNTFREQSK